MATSNRAAGFPAAVIFDLDGTLVDSRRDLADAANAARQAAGRPPLDEATVTGHVGDGVEALVRRVLAHGTGVAPQDVAPAALAEGLARFREVYGRHCLDHTRCYPGVVAMLAACAPRPLFVATNKARAFTLAILQGLGLASRFAGVVAGDDVPLRKPRPEHLAACLAGRAWRPADVAVVGDGVNDVRSARAFGAVSVAATWGFTPRDVLAAERPDHLADSPAAVTTVLGLDART